MDGASETSGAKGGAGAPLDLIAIGRASVDLYGEQVGGRLEDMASFAKYVGGSPTNTAIGGARLGLRTALLTRVGADHMGRFIQETLRREGVDDTHVLADPDRLTALVLLGIRDAERFPLIFYREKCADMALSDADVDPALIARADAVLINGTHLSRPGVFAASMKAATLIKAKGGRVVFDIDYRPVLWEVAAREQGETRFVAAPQVTAQLVRVLPLVDLVIGTEEEIHVLGGSTDTLAALRAIRAQTDALIVCKRGALGCVAFEGAIPASIDEGLVAPGHPVEVLNVLGAGDGFMAGFLRGWLRGEPITTCCAWANGCGALVVSRHGCAPAMPSWDELQTFLAREDGLSARDLEQRHWATTRGQPHHALKVLAIDHRRQFDEMMDTLGLADAAAITAFKALAVRAMDRMAAGDPDFGVLLDGRYGARALEAAADTPYWIGRPIEVPGSRPLAFEGAADVAVTLREWPLQQVVKCLVHYHPNDPVELRAAQDAQLLRLFAAARATRHELMLEVLASEAGPLTSNTVADILEHFYRIGLFPDWWKLEPADDPAAWTAIAATIARHDPQCRGVVLLGRSASEAVLVAGFAAAAPCPIVKGFAVGRTIWHDVAVAWLTNSIDDEEAIRRLTSNFRGLIEAWQRLRGPA